MFFELLVQPHAVAAWNQDPAECRVASPEQIARLKAAGTDAATADHRQRMTSYEDRLFAEFVVPEGPWPSPPPDARVLFRTIAPPGGLYGNTIWTAVWQESDGSWWFWKQDRDPRMVPQPPQPGSAPRVVSDTERWPPASGRLRAQNVQAIEASLSDPCRAAAGPFWPGEVPYVPPPPPPGAPMLPPPPPTPPVPDSTVVYVQMTEQGQPMQRLGAWGTGHGNRLISAVAWPQAEVE